KSRVTPETFKGDETAPESVQPQNDPQEPDLTRKSGNGSRPPTWSSQHGRCRNIMVAVTASKEAAGRVGSCKRFPCGSRSRDAARAPGAPSRSARCSRGCGW